MTLMKRDETFPVWNSFLNDFFSRDWNDWNLKNFSNTNTTLPSVNIKETTDDFVVEMAAPGMKKEDFKIELENYTLTISSEKKDEKTENKEGDKYTRREFSYQSFSRSFTLPLTADQEKISAKYDSGVLILTIPKREEAKPKPAKQIEIM